MVRNQKNHHLAVNRFKTKPFESAGGSLQASGHVVIIRHTLADIMEQESQKEQVGTFECIQNVAEAAFQFAVGSSQRMDVFNRHKRMFVDRVAVVIVANDKRIDCLELRKQQNQHPQPVHS